MWCEHTAGCALAACWQLLKQGVAEASLHLCLPVSACLLREVAQTGVPGRRRVPRRAEAGPADRRQIRAVRGAQPGWSHHRGHVPCLSRLYQYCWYAIHLLPGVRLISHFQKHWVNLIQIPLRGSRAASCSCTCIYLGGESGQGICATYFKELLVKLIRGQLGGSLQPGLQGKGEAAHSMLKEGLKECDTV